MKETTSARLRRLLSERNLRQVDILEKAAPRILFTAKCVKSFLAARTACLAFTDKASANKYKIRFWKLRSLVPQNQKQGRSQK